MRVADLVDLECLFREASDSLGGARSAGALTGAVGGDAGERRARRAVQAALEEQGIAPDAARARVPADPVLRRTVFGAWIAAERKHRADDLPGRAVESALGLVGRALLTVGLLFGAGAAGGLLHYDGEVPVNVLWFVAMFFALQIGLLIGTLWFVLRAGRKSGSPGPGWIHLGVAALLRRFLGERGQRVARLMEDLRHRHGVLARIEAWTLFTLVQRFGVGFNVGALLACLTLVAFSDLVFSWSTTLEVEASTAHTIAESFALPWSWLMPDACPDLAAVESSRWSRMQSAFVGGTSQADAERLAAGWWQFLVVGLCVYGLLPRSLSWWFGATRARRLRNALQLDDGAAQQALDRLLPRTGWDAPRPDEVRGAAPVPSVDPAAQHSMPAAPAGAAAAFLAWGSFPEPAVTPIAQRLGLGAALTSSVGGADLAADDTALASLRGAELARVVLVVDAGQQPTKDALRFLVSLRQTLGAGRPIAVVVVERAIDGSVDRDADPEEREVWRRSLASLGDTHLWLQELGA